MGHGEGGGDDARDAMPVHNDEGEAVTDDHNPENAEQDDDEEEEEEAEPHRPLRDPGMPSKEECEKHCITHIPPRPWCPHCLRGKGKNRPSLRLCGAYSENLVPRVRMDYDFLTENNGDEDKVENEGDDDGEKIAKTEVESSKQAILVMQESECRSVWAYAVDRKDATKAWMVYQLCEDLETVGLKNDRIIAKTDQEASASDVAKEVARQRVSLFGTAGDNSSVGESDTNGTIERAIQDVNGQCRTLRSALEDRIKTVVRLKSHIVPWLIRHAAYLITRCRVRPSGRTAFQIMKGRRSNGKLPEFGEIVHFMIPKTKDMPGKFEDRWSEGVWLGCDMRSGEDLVGMPSGVFRVSTVRRKPMDSRWSPELISSMRGSPTQPVPGQAYNRTPAFSRKFGNQERRDGLYAPQDPDVIPGVRDWKIYKKDIEMHGPPDGCAGCRAIVTGSLSKQPHTRNCRRRLQELIMETEEGRMRVQRAARRVEGAANHSDDRQQGGEEVLPPPAEPPRHQTQASAAPSQDQDMAPGP